MQSAPSALNAPGSWQATLANDLPKLGHRNWIAIVNSAYPAQTRNGIETVVTDADQSRSQDGLEALAGSKHVRPIVYTDAELNYVDEQDAPGVGPTAPSSSRFSAGRSASSLPTSRSSTSWMRPGRRSIS